jgi:hypothetical protein
MQIVKARDLSEARNSYLHMLAQRGITVPPTLQIFVETVHRPVQDGDSWLCYLGGVHSQAA